MSESAPVSSPPTAQWPGSPPATPAAPAPPLVQAVLANAAARAAASGARRDLLEYLRLRRKPA
jgi:hypothetical protein